MILVALLISSALAGEFCDELREKPRSYRQNLGPVVGLGASVTAGFGGVEGPAKRLARILDVPYRSHAANGATSTTSLARWKSDDEVCGTAVGLDLFFWDTVRACNPNSVKELLRQVSAHKCKRGIFSHVPRLINLQRANCITSINRELDNGVAIDVLAVMDELRRDSRRASFFQTDRIHLTEAGAEAATEKLCQILL